MKLLIWLNILFLVNIHGAIQRTDPLVVTNNGMVRGIAATDGNYSKFLGIPYAIVDPSNPFGAGTEVPPFWLFDANDNSVTCPQTQVGHFEIPSTVVQSIDCLQLSVYVPNTADIYNLHPVLVWVHGGGFRLGSGNEYEPQKLVDQGIIVVTVNYRLGPYGFMCLDDPAVPGNQGLKDVHQALVWVRNNIDAFGGDPYNVTLAGQSAGAIITLSQLYSTKEKLYDKIIAQSGTPFSPQFFTNGDSEAAVKLANFLGLNTTDNQQALTFLAQTNYSLVTGAAYNLNINFTPCLERSFSGVENFIDRVPYAFSNETKISNTPILIGNNDYEYLNLIPTLHGDDFLTKDIFNEILSEKFNLEKEQQEKIASIIRNHYIGDKPISEEIQKEAEYFLGDFEFYHPTEETIENLIRYNANPIYKYVFTYVGNTGAAGVAHTVELPYLFNVTGSPNMAETDSVFVDRFTTLWANFIKYGNLNPEAPYPPVTKTTRPYLNIGSELRVDERFQKERNAFWQLFQDAYGNYSTVAP